MATAQELAALEPLIEQVRRTFFVLRAITDHMLGDLDCTAPERSLLQELAKSGSQTVSALARTRAISRQAMQKVVDKLLARRWVAAHPNPAHARSPLIALAAAGEKLFAEIGRREAEVLRALKLPMSARELRVVTDGLRALTDHLAATTRKGTK